MGKGKGKGSAGGRLIRAALKDLRKIKKRRGASHSARPTKAAKPSRQASYAARRQADRARVAGRTSGTSESVTTPDGQHTFSSTSGQGYPLHRRVQASIDTMPPDTVPRGTDSALFRKAFRKHLTTEWIRPVRRWVRRGSVWVLDTVHIIPPAIAASL